jgi:hypothetical protein
MASTNTLIVEAFAWVSMTFLVAVVFALVFTVTPVASVGGVPFYSGPALLNLRTPSVLLAGIE